MLERHDSGGDKPMEQQLVIFELHNEFYGIDIAVVESIIKMQAITQLNSRRPLPTSKA
jgi:chemotaxis signal transduction protein